jgi:hypothetical protein
MKKVQIFKNGVRIIEHHEFVLAIDLCCGKTSVKHVTIHQVTTITENGIHVQGEIKEVAIC